MTSQTHLNAVTQLKTALRRSEAWILGLVDGIKDAPLTFPTPQGGNHPLWVMGHLAVAEGRFHCFMRGGSHPYPGWLPIFGRGSQPEADAAKYPPFDEVVAAFRTQRARTYSLLDELTDADLETACIETPPGRAEAFGTLGSTLLTAAMHTMLHAGQIADARRAAGRDPVMG